MNATELTDHKSASDALYSHDSNIDLEKQLFFGFQFGVSENDIIKTIGNPSAIYEVNDLRNLYYGRDVVFIFKKGKLSGVIAGRYLIPYNVDRIDDSFQALSPRWTIGKLKYGDKKKLVEDTLEIKSFWVEQSRFNKKEIMGMKIQVDYYRDETKNAITNEQEYLNNVKIEKTEANKADSPNGLQP